MNCRRARNLLELHRPGERTPARDRALQEHLRHCDSCRREAERIERNAALIREAAAEKTFSGNAQRIREQVIRRLGAPGFPEGKPSVRFKYIAPVRSLVWIRYALGGVASGVILLLSFQTGALMQRVAELETRMSGIASAPAGEYSENKAPAGFSVILERMFPDERKEIRRMNPLDLLRIAAAVNRLDDIERAALLKLIRSLEKEGIIGENHTVDIDRLRSRLREWAPPKNRSRFF